jgi:hypothetical protein
LSNINLKVERHEKEEAKEIKKDTIKQRQMKGKT